MLCLTDVGEGRMFSQSLEAPSHAVPYRRGGGKNVLTVSRGGEFMSSSVMHDKQWREDARELQ